MDINDIDIASSNIIRNNNQDQFENLEGENIMMATTRKKRVVIAKVKEEAVATSFRSSGSTSQ